MLTSQSRHGTCYGPRNVHDCFRSRSIEWNSPEGRLSAFQMKPVYTARRVKRAWLSSRQQFKVLEERVSRSIEKWVGCCELWRQLQGGGWDCVYQRQSLLFTTKYLESLVNHKDTFREHTKTIPVTLAVNVTSRLPFWDHLSVLRFSPSNHIRTWIYQKLCPRSWCL